MAVEPLIHLEQVSRAYAVGPRTLYALRETTLDIWRGEYTAILGPSGSGKSTLLNLIGGIDQPTTGRVVVAGYDLTRLDENALARWRGAHIGIVFQFFQLLPTLTAQENVLLPMELRGRSGSRQSQRERAQAALVRVGLGDRMDQLPSELSGGEQQRVALARALANDPPILLADEPTGNLDSVTGLQVIELLGSLAASGKTIVLVTHEARFAMEANRVIRMSDGRIVEETRRLPALGEEVRE